MQCVLLCYYVISGLLAIMRSMQVRDYKVLGNGALAQIASKSARKLIRLAVVFGLLGLLFVALYFGTAIAWLVHVTNQGPGNQANVQANLPGPLQN